jgi:glycosyltransferase involved in cell wall biosynthesis
LNPDIAMLAAPHPEAFAEAMVELAANPALRRDLAERARRVVQTEYSLARYRQVLGDAYDRLSVSLSTRSAPASSG